ncbi:asparagine synthase (glutamine-hydrolyzing) [Rhodohalobacter sp. 8-1]|uniref:asparagine synthase (glutamine-hydrolyzing) n=1 Tax=Rhodohalobacter sp. 8-1 TaxID=3131972 RepID=UPI0030EDAC2B
MCGINGILGEDNSDLLHKQIFAMNESISHRGPDDSGILLDGDLGLGHQRLSILDLSEAGHQPMLSRDKRYSIVFNGEIYNYKEIKEQLPDYRFKSKTDTEVILASYIKWGKECVERFNGMFAFAIWDSDERNLFIARDRIGIKPLYYYRSDSLFLFSSELRALLNSGRVPRKLNKNAVADYLRYQTVHAPYTMVEDLFMLMPGHSMTISRNNIDINQYWHAEKFISGRPVGNYDQVKKKVRDLLLESVEKRLIADVPIGAFLSGGIDSSAIVGLMSEVSPGNVKTFSVTFDEGEFDEAVYSNMVAEKFKTDHTEIRLKPDNFLDLIPEALNAMDHPSGDGPNTYIVSKKTRESGVTVALSGLGGDELFGGYPVFSHSLKLEKFRLLANLPHTSRMFFSNLLKASSINRALNKAARVFEKEDFDISHSYPVSREIFTDLELGDLINKNNHYHQSNRVKDIVTYLNPMLNSNALISKISIAEMQTYMVNTLLRDTDQMSMASGLEVRVPFLDHDLIQYVLSLSDGIKVPSTPKKLLTDALGDLLPDEVVYRKKMGFNLPWEHWMKNELRENIISNIDTLKENEFFHGETVERLKTDFFEEKTNVHWLKLWLLFVLQEWMNKNNVEL